MCVCVCVYEREREGGGRNEFIFELQVPIHILNVMICLSGILPQLWRAVIVSMVLS